MEFKIGHLVNRVQSFFGYEKARAFVTPTDASAAVPGGMGKATQQNYKNYLKQYTDTAWVFTCIQRIASQGAGIQLRLYRKTIKNEKIEITQVFNHPINTLLKKVNPFTTGLQLLENTISFEELTGNAYWLLDSFVNGKPTEIYSLRPDRVKVIPDKVNYIKGYSYEIAPSKFITFQPEQIIHFKYFNSTDDYYGLSPLSAGRMAIDTQQLVDIYNQQFYANSAQPAGALVSVKGIKENNKKRIAAAWKQMHQGTRNSHKIAILEGGLDWKALGISQKDMDFIQQKKMTREDIMGVFGVPPAMVGVFEYANYANSKEQREIFWRNTEVPKLNQIAAIINEFLVKPWDESLEVEFDYSTVDALQTDINVKATTDEILTRSGIKTINEARADRGLAPVEWGGIWYAPLNVAPVGSQAPSTEPAPEPELTPPEEERIAPVNNIEEKFQTWCLKAASIKAKAEARKYIVEQTLKGGEKIDLINDRIKDIIAQGEPISITPIPINASVKIEPPKEDIELPKQEIEDEEEKAKKEIRTKFWLIYKDLVEDWEKKFIKFLRKEFKIQEDETLMNLEDVGLKNIRKDVADDQIDKILFDKNNADKAMRKGANHLTEGSLVANANKEIAALGLGISFDLQNPEVQKWITNKVFKFADEVDTNTQKKLRVALKKSITAGESIPQAQVRVEKVFKEVSDEWAGVIARTEVVSSTNAGAMAAYEQASDLVVGTEWITSRDAKVRDTHQIDGEIAKLGEQYSNGLQFPGDPTAGAEEVINCRCTQRGVLK